jgi:hypothetical protein
LNVSVEPLRIYQTDLNTERMLKLMAVNQVEAPMPLYMHTVIRILRGMRMKEQESSEPFDYEAFKKLIDEENMEHGQLRPFNQRLGTLESFMPTDQTTPTDNAPEEKKIEMKKTDLPSGNDWTPTVFVSATSPASLQIGS